MALRAADFVANPIEQRLAEIRLKGSFVAGLERMKALHDLRERVLHEILCVERATGPGRQAPVRPPLEPREIPRAQLVEGGGVARLSPGHQDVRRLGIAP
jgi:hypothetical protein